MVWLLPKSTGFNELTSMVPDVPPSTKSACCDLSITLLSTSSDGHFLKLTARLGPALIMLRPLSVEYPQYDPKPRMDISFWLPLSL